MKTENILKSTLAVVMTVSLSACGKTEKNTVTESPDEIIVAISEEANTRISQLQTDYADIKENIDSYDAYIQKTDTLTEWYANINETTEEFFSDMEEYYESYYRLMFDTCSDIKELEDSLDLFYKQVYEGTFEDLYKRIYEGLIKDAYEDIYEDILSQTYDSVSYDELYATCSNFYDAWYDACSTWYTVWLDGLSRYYTIWSTMYGSIYNGNRDYDSLMQEVRSEENDNLPVDTQEENIIENENEPVEETIEQPVMTSGIRPEFQQAMDDYLAFFTEYCEFMKALSNSQNDLSLLAQYADFMTSYSETLNSLEAIDENELSDEELALYIDTSAQIQKMLLEVA